MAVSLKLFRSSELRWNEAKAASPRNPGEAKLLIPTSLQRAPDKSADTT